jgi:hypothetical protein
MDREIRGQGFISEFPFFIYKGNSEMHQLRVSLFCYPEEKNKRKSRMKTVTPIPQYATSSIYEAAYLLAKGFTCLKIENSGTAYKKIVFENSPEAQKAIAAFYSNGKVPVLTFVNAYRRLKGEIFSWDSIKQ